MLIGIGGACYYANPKTVNTWNNQSEATSNHKPIIVTVTVCSLVFSCMIGFLLETHSRFSVFNSRIAVLIRKGAFIIIYHYGTRKMQVTS